MDSRLLLSFGDITIQNIELNLSNIIHTMVMVNRVLKCTIKNTSHEIRIIKFFIYPSNSYFQTRLVSILTISKFFPPWLLLLFLPTCSRTAQGITVKQFGITWYKIFRTICYVTTSIVKLMSKYFLFLRKVFVNFAWFIFFV